MQKQITKDDYIKRVQRVIDHVYTHLDQDLSLEELAGVACLSPYHWHRIYRSVTGETVTQTIRRLRLQRAAQMLVETHDPLAKIAQRAGYSHLESFSRKFQEAFGKTPVVYRSEGQEWVQALHTFPTLHTKGIENMYDVKIHQQEPLRLATLDHQGNYMDIGRVFETLITTSTHHDLLTPEARLFGLYYDDPQVTPEDELRSKAGISLASDVACPADLEQVIVPEGLYGQIIHKGPYNELETAYSWLYKVWLLDSGYEPAASPVVEEYLNNPRETSPNELLTSINLPLKT